MPARRARLEVLSRYLHMPLFPGNGMSERSWNVGAQLVDLLI